MRLAERDRLDLRVRRVEDVECRAACQSDVISIEHLYLVVDDEVVDGAKEVVVRRIRQAERPQAAGCDAVERDGWVVGSRPDRTVELQGGAGHGSDIIRRDAVAVRRLGEIEHPSGRGDSADAIEIGGGRGSCRHRAEAGQLRGGVAERYATGVSEGAAVQFDRAVGDAFGSADRQVAGRADFQRLVAGCDANRSTRGCGRCAESPTPAC